MSNIQSRKWLLTINNPEEHKITKELVIELLNLFHPNYYCFVFELSDSGTIHMHIFIYSTSPIRFNTIKNRFPVAHIDKANGSVTENRNYLLKVGTEKNKSKAHTNLKDTFYEFGEIPAEGSETNPEMTQIIEEIEEGVPIYVIVKNHPKYALRLKELEYLRQRHLEEKYKSVMRPVVVIYIYGISGTGKTRGIYKRHNANEIYRVTSYKNGIPCFDTYSANDVLVFEEFASQVSIESMLNYLDIYPLMLPARYSDKVACYTTVYITSNMPLEAQYLDVQRGKMETWNAFMRRINKVIEYRDVDDYVVTELNPVTDIEEV